jgi:hypothetical protein
VTSRAHAQTAYFSVEGEFSTAGDELDLLFLLEPAVSSPTTMRFETFASSGGTNAVGDTIADGPGDSVLRLINSAGNTIAEDDDRSFLSRDSLIGFGEGDTPLPSPLGVGNYRLNLADFDDDTDPYAVDLVAPADACCCCQFNATLPFRGSSIHWRLAPPVEEVIRLPFSTSPA